MSGIRGSPAEVCGDSVADEGGGYGPSLEPTRVSADSRLVWRPRRKVFGDLRSVAAL